MRLSSRTFVALLLGFFLLYAAGAAFFHAAHSADKLPSGKWRLTDVTGRLPDLAFEMEDDTDTPITEDAVHGHVTLLYFGYTKCPDQCPAVLSRLAGIMKKLGNDSDRVRVLFATIDPDTDTPQVLHNYLKNFDSAHMIGITGTDSQTRDLTKRFAVSYQPHAMKKPGATHSGAIYIFDPDGHARLIASPSDSDTNIIHDIRRLLKLPDYG